MKKIAIFAMLAVCVLLATPLLTTNAMAAIDEREMTTGADWDYRVYGDANGNILCVMIANGDVIGGEWYGEDGQTTIQFGGAYPSDAVDWSGDGPNQLIFSTSDTNPGSLHIILTGPYGDIEAAGTGNLYEEI